VRLGRATLEAAATGQPAGGNGDWSTRLTVDRQVGQRGDRLDLDADRTSSNKSDQRRDRPALGDAKLVGLVNAEVCERLCRLALHRVRGHGEQTDEHLDATLFCHPDLV